MKNFVKIIAFGIVGALITVVGCKDPFDQDPVPATSASNYFANFIFGNAVNADLDFYANNLKTESTPVGVGQTAYTHSAIPSNGIFANYNLRAKAPSGTIGGALGGADAVFRSANNGTNNFTALDSAYYTVIVMDSITRPAPVRTYVDSTGFADVTLFDPLNGTQIALTDTASMNLPNAERLQLVTIGTVPLGSTDPGGPRFLVITDQLPLPSATRFPKPPSGKAAVRFVNGIADAPTVTVAIASSAFGGSFAYPMVNSAAYNPTVGSRTLASLAFTNVNFGTGVLVEVKYNSVTIASDTFDLDDGAAYTIFATGFRKADNVAIGIIKNK